jgi:hypothetical protein
VAHGGRVGGAEGRGKAGPRYIMKGIRA